MSSLLNKLKGHSNHQETDSHPTESYNQPSSNTGYDNQPSSNTKYDNTQGGYGDTTSPSHRGETGYGNTSNTSSGYDNGPLSTHSDGGKYHAPKGTHVGQGNNTETAGPHNSSLLNKTDPRVDSDQSKLNRNTQQGYGEHGHNQPGYGNSRGGYGNDQAGYGTTTTTTTNTSTSVGHDQYGTTYGNTDDHEKRLPKDPAHPSALERANPAIDTDSSRRHERGTNAGYGPGTGSDQYDSTHGSSKRLPEDPNHPTMKEKLDPRYDTKSSQRQDGYDNTGYGSNTTGQRGQNDQYAAGAAGAYGGTESGRHHAQPVHNDESSMLNRSHPVTSMHQNDRRYDSNRADQSTGPDGEYLPGPAPNTAGPHKSDMLNKYDPRVDSDQSKLEKERERQGYGTESGYGSTGIGPPGTTYGNEHERRINEGHHEKRHEGHRHEGHRHDGAGGIDRHDQYSSNAPDSTRDSGYGGQGSTTSNLTHRKPLNETGGYGNEQYGRGAGTDDRSNPAGTYSNTPSTTANQATTSPHTGAGYGNDNNEHDFECAKCGHKNTHLRKTKTDQSGNAKPGLMAKLNPKVDATGDGQAGFMK